MNMTFSGGKELEAFLKDLGGQISGRLGQNAVNAGARVIAAKARLRVTGPHRPPEALDPGIYLMLCRRHASGSLYPSVAREIFGVRHG
jgi:hypothetical protein